MPAMVKYVGGILEFRWGKNGHKTVEIECDPHLRPAPGQYMFVDEMDPFDVQPVGWSVFPSGYTSRGFLASTMPDPLPATWSLETRFMISGPHGQGFSIPNDLRTLALVSLSPFPHRLLPVIQTALEEKTDIALFMDGPAPFLPPVVEIQPLPALSGALDWADYLAVDLQIDDLPNFRQKTHLNPDRPLPPTAQALVYTPMPCGGIADCGVCAVRTRRSKHVFACKVGPVFQLKDLGI